MTAPDRSALVEQLRALPRWMFPNSQPVEVNGSIVLPHYVKYTDVEAAIEASALATSVSTAQVQALVERYKELAKWWGDTSLIDRARRDVYLGVVNNLARLIAEPQTGAEK